MEWPTIPSSGLNKWGHFTSSKRSMELDEPIYLNLWTAQLLAGDLPEGLKEFGYGTNDKSQGDETSQTANVVLEGLRSVGGLETQPGLGSAVVQKYKHAERGFLNGAPSKTHLELTMQFELNVRRDSNNVNDNYTYKFLRRWVDLGYDPLTGRMNIKKNYAAKAMTFLLHDKEGQPIHQWICYNIFPISGIQAPNLTYENGGIWQNFPMTFWCDYYDEAIL